jgi:hypothetical protein
MPFIRSAKSGGWKAELPAASVAEIESAWGGLMREMGYELLGPKKTANLDSRSTEAVLNGPLQ